MVILLTISCVGVKYQETVNRVIIIVIDVYSIWIVRIVSDKGKTIAREIVFAIGGTREEALVCIISESWIQSVDLVRSKRAIDSNDSVPIETRTITGRAIPGARVC